MTITLNNTVEELPANINTIKALLEYKNYSFPNIVVKINGILIRKTEYNNATFGHGDKVDLIHLISGG